MSAFSKKIVFHSQYPQFDIPKPIPASRVVPEWYRSMPGVRDRIETVKKCIPVLDSLTSGYVIPLAADAWYSKESKQIISISPVKLNSDHMLDHTMDVEVSDEFDPQPHKWINYWYIKTPKGYSTLFTHPLNREDLPFRSFTGIVDTDKHPLIINFPFLIKKDFDGMIPAGTPIIQLIPFKRDSWDSEVIDNKEGYSFEREYEHMNPPFAWYKRKHWSKKVFR